MPPVVKDCLHIHVRSSPWRVSVSITTQPKPLTPWVKEHGEVVNRNFNPRRRCFASCIQPVIEPCSHGAIHPLKTSGTETEQRHKIRQGACQGVTLMNLLW